MHIKKKQMNIEKSMHIFSTHRLDDVASGDSSLIARTHPLSSGAKELPEACGGLFRGPFCRGAWVKSLEIACEY